MTKAEAQSMGYCGWKRPIHALLRATFPMKTIILAAIRTTPDVHARFEIYRKVLSKYDYWTCRALFMYLTSLVSCSRWPLSKTETASPRRRKP